MINWFGKSLKNLKLDYDKSGKIINYFIYVKTKLILKITNKKCK
jgi:hypothetical protein